MFFSGFSSVESSFCTVKKFGIKLALVSIIFLCDSSIQPKRAATLFYKKVVPLNLDFVHWEMNKISYPIKRLEN